jgi:C4-dicarboxylate-specific signal transduction histidine kinase
VKRLIDGFGGKIDVEKNHPTGEVFIIRLKEANG